MNLEDAQQRWCDTIVRIKGIPTYVERVDEADGAGRFKFRSHTAKEDSSWITSTVIAHVDDVDETFPELGNRQHGVAVQHFTRRATHQWRRGIVPRQLSAQKIGNTKAFTGEVVPALPFPSPALLSMVYNTEYPAMLQAVREVMQGSYLARAFSHDLAVAAGASRWPVLYYKTSPVGLVKGDIVELAAPAACLRELVQEQSPLRVTVK